MKNKNKIQVINWLLTRRCNLKCDYCGIVRNSIVYRKTIDMYKNSEMNFDFIKEVLNNVVDLNKNCFHIFYGGEPFLYPYLSDVIKFCNKRNIFYTIITNNTKEIQLKIEDVLKETKYFQGLSASIDPIIFTENENLKKSDRYKKSLMGYENLKKLKPFVNDLVAEITVDSENIQYLDKLVENLSENNIYSSITFIDLKKNDYYDFSNVIESDLLIYPTNENYIILQNLINKGYLIHMGEELLDRIFDILPHKLDCKIEDYNHNLTIDADGSIRLCLRIKGIQSQNYSALDYFSNFEKVYQAMLNDKKYLCRGCCWTCPIMSKLSIEESMTNELIHIERR